MNTPANSRFKFFPQLNTLERVDWLSSANTFHTAITDKLCQTDSLSDTFLRKLADTKILPVKEVFETFEFFTRIRKLTRSPVMADLCCGHGLLGILFAMYEREVEQVFLIDKEPNINRQKTLEVAISVAPWIEKKLNHRVAKICSEDEWIAPGIAIVSAHACGTLSDLCIEIAIKSGGAVAILPCCYPKAKCNAPLSLQTEFGLEKAFDIDRTYRLEAAGYQVRWAEIPIEITPMNRVLYASRRKNQTEKRSHKQKPPLEH